MVQQGSEKPQLKQQSRRLRLAGIGLYFLSACTVPQARIPPGTLPMAYVPSIEEEDQAEEIFIDLSEDYTLDVTSLQHDELQGMFNNLAAAANINPVNWKVHLFDDPEMVDVRAIRGNYLFVWSGVFDVVEDRDEIAGLLVLSQGAVAVSGTGMSRWLYVEAADLDDLDRVYDAQQVQEMADIALQILARSEYSPEALLAFWKRAEADDEVQRRVKRLSRRISPAERVAVLETAMQGMSLEKEQATEPDAGDELAALPMAAPM